MLNDLLQAFQTVIRQPREGRRIPVATHERITSKYKRQSRIKLAQVLLFHLEGWSDKKLLLLSSRKKNLTSWHPRSKLAARNPINPQVPADAKIKTTWTRFRWKIKTVECIKAPWNVENLYAKTHGVDRQVLFQVQRKYRESTPWKIILRIILKTNF